MNRDPVAWLIEQGICVETVWREDGRRMYRVLVTKEQLENLKLPEKSGIWMWLSGQGLDD